MSLIIKFFAFLLVLGLAGLFVLKDPNGQPFLSWDNFIPEPSSIASSIEQVLPEQVAISKDTAMVYRWQDANGNWQFSDVPPDNVAVEQIIVETHLNSDIAPPAPTSRPVVSNSGSGRAVFIGDSNKPSPGVGTTASPDNIKQLIEDAQNVQGLMDNRTKQLDESLK